MCTLQSSPTSKHTCHSLQNHTASLIGKYLPHGFCIGSFLSLQDSFLKGFIYLFLERGERREKKKERNINVWLPLTHSCWGPGLQPRHGPILGNQTPWFAGQHSIHSTNPSQGSFQCSLARSLYCSFSSSLLVFIQMTLRESCLCILLTIVP